VYVCMYVCMYVTRDTEGREGCSFVRVTMGQTHEEYYNELVVTGACKIAGTEARDLALRFPC
jgi:hypothetical protein